jgi:hypothetical protein
MKKQYSQRTARRPQGGEKEFAPNAADAGILLK